MDYISGLHVAGPDPARFQDREHENPPVPLFSQTCGIADGINYRLNPLVLHDNIDRDLWQKINIQNPSTKLEVYPVLLAATLNLANSHTVYSLSCQSLLDEGEAFFTNDCPNELHFIRPPVQYDNCSSADSLVQPAALLIRSL